MYKKNSKDLKLFLQWAFMNLNIETIDKILKIKPTAELTPT